MSTETTLFPTPESTHPRDSWLSTNNLRVTDYLNRRNGGWDRHSLNTDRFMCHNKPMTRFASGATAEQAEAAYAARYGIPWWKMAGWNGAMDGAAAAVVDVDWE